MGEWLPTAVVDSCFFDKRPIAFAQQRVYMYSQSGVRQYLRHAHQGGGDWERWTELDRSIR